jgi:hypothetical protein
VLERSELKCRLHGHQDLIMDICHCSAMNSLATCSLDLTVRVWYGIVWASVWEGGKDCVTDCVCLMGCLLDDIYIYICGYHLQGYDARRNHYGAVPHTYVALTALTAPRVRHETYRNSCIQRTLLCSRIHSLHTCHAIITLLVFQSLPTNLLKINISIHNASKTLRFPALAKASSLSSVGMKRHVL